MGLIYYPSCKFTAKYPDLSKRIKTYMAKTHGAEIASCCKPTLGKLTADDTVVYICNTCATFFRESTPAKALSIWELLFRDASFPYPDYEGRTVTVQDCWRTHDDRAEQDAVRQVLHNMKMDVVELEDNFEKTLFCGASLYEKLLPKYDVFAPARFGTEAAEHNFFQERPPEEREALMKAHCAQITTDQVVSYCVSCTNGIALGGKNSLHLAELLFV